MATVPGNNNKAGKICTRNSATQMHTNMIKYNSGRREKGKRVKQWVPTKLLKKRKFLKNKKGINTYLLLKRREITVFSYL